MRVCLLFSSLCVLWTLSARVAASTLQLSESSSVSSVTFTPLPQRLSQNSALALWLLPGNG